MFVKHNNISPRRNAYDSLTTKQRFLNKPGYSSQQGN